MKTTKKEIDNTFKLFILPAIKITYEKDGIKDIPARREGYNNYIDALHKDGSITEKQANRYCIHKRFI